MLRQVYIFKNKILIYKKLFGKALEKENFEFLKKEIFSGIINTFQYWDHKRDRISYLGDEEFNLLFLFINTIVDDPVIIERELVKCKENFVNLFKDNLLQKFDANSLKSFDPVIYSFQNKFPPKISLVGYKEVGKTTIFNLIRTKEIPLKHDSQIGGDIALLKIGKIHFLLRDFTEQEEIGFLWNNFIKGSDAVIIITDSSLENINKSKFFLNKTKEETPLAYTCGLGNKQDLKDILEPAQIEEILNLKVYPVIATDSEYQDTLLRIILKTLEMFEQIAPILKLMYDKEILINEFEIALIEVNLEKADSIYEKIVNICIELGENLQELEFYNKYQEIQNRLKRSESQQELVISTTSTIAEQYSPKRISSLDKLLTTLLKNYMKNTEGIISVIVSDRDGFIITSVSSEQTEDESLLGALAVTIDTFIERIKREFGDESSFFNVTTIQDNKFAYCSKGSKSILLTISNLSPSDTELRVYSEHVATKIELILEGNENISLEIPEIVRILSKTKEGKIPEGQFSFKLILTGDYAVGKTSLIQRYVLNLFKEDYHSTVGVDISQREIELSENTKIKFVIWDIGGQLPKMAPYRKKFYEGAKFAFIVIDRTRLDSLKSVDKWYDEIKNYVKTDIDIILIGNKSDLTDQFIISESDIKRVADKHDFHYILTSAKSGENVNDAFLYVAYKFLESV
ncbi:MAG: ADP-ribosylation factor-like protein [Promethearchaeota archaeon]